MGNKFTIEKIEVDKDQYANVVAVNDDFAVSLVTGLMYNLDTVTSRELIEDVPEEIQEKSFELAEASLILRQHEKLAEEIEDKGFAVVDGETVNAESLEQIISNDYAGFFDALGNIVDDYRAWTDEITAQDLDLAPFAEEEEEEEESKNAYTSSQTEKKNNVNTRISTRDMEKLSSDISIDDSTKIITLRDNSQFDDRFSRDGGAYSFYKTYTRTEKGGDEWEEIYGNSSDFIFEENDYRTVTTEELKRIISDFERKFPDRDNCYVETQGYLSKTFDRTDIDSADKVESWIINQEALNNRKIDTLSVSPDIRPEIAKMVEELCEKRGIEYAGYPDRSIDQQDSREDNEILTNTYDKYRLVQVETIDGRNGLYITDGSDYISISNPGAELKKDNVLSSTPAENIPADLKQKCLEIADTADDLKESRAFIGELQTDLDAMSDRLMKIDKLASDVPDKTESSWDNSVVDSLLDQVNPDMKIEYISYGDQERVLSVNINGVVNIGINGDVIDNDNITSRSPVWALNSEFENDCYDFAKKMVVMDKLYADLDEIDTKFAVQVVEASNDYDEWNRSEEKILADNLNDGIKDYEKYIDVLQQGVNIDDSRISEESRSLWSNLKYPGYSKNLTFVTLRSDPETEIVANNWNNGEYFLSESGERILPEEIVSQRRVDHYSELVDERLPEKFSELIGKDRLMDSIRDDLAKYKNMLDAVLSPSDDEKYIPGNYDDVKLEIAAVGDEKELVLNIHDEAYIVVDGVMQGWAATPDDFASYTPLENIPEELQEKCRETAKMYDSYVMAEEIRNSMGFNLDYVYTGIINKQIEQLKNGSLEITSGIKDVNDRSDMTIEYITSNAGGRYGESILSVNVGGEYNIPLDGGPVFKSDDILSRTPADNLPDQIKSEIFDFADKHVFLDKIEDYARNNFDNHIKQLQSIAEDYSRFAESEHSAEQNSEPEFDEDER